MAWKKLNRLNINEEEEKALVYALYTIYASRKLTPEQETVVKGLQKKLAAF